MNIMIQKLLIDSIALEHLFFLWMEMFAWKTIGKKTFGSKIPDFFEITAPLAANQGLYNGFLAGGLVWSLCIQNELWSFYVTCYFLICIIIAGVYGAYSVHRKIFLVQALPALITLFICLYARLLK